MPPTVMFTGHCQFCALGHKERSSGALFLLTSHLLGRVDGVRVGMLRGLLFILLSK